MEKFVSASNLRTTTESIVDFIENKLDGKSFKYLTLAEYEALSDSEKNRDDIVYQITDKQLSYNDLTDKPYIPNIVILTQAEYDQLEASGNEDPNVYYLISDGL